MQIELLVASKTSKGIIESGLVILPEIEARKLIIAGKARLADLSLGIANSPNRMLKTMITR